MTGQPLEQQLPAAVREYLPAAPSGLLEPYFRLAEPVRQLFALQMPLVETA
jgi:hypothetical protein